jgi:hypothetical protein
MYAAAHACRTHAYRTDPSGPHSVKQELKCLATVDVLPSTQKPIAISAVSTRAVPYREPTNANQLDRAAAGQLVPQALLFVGFEDGSVRTYVLQDLFQA